MWPHCYDLGLAAITYWPLENTDLSKYPEHEPKELWAKLATSQHASLSRVAYEMKGGDVIYVKQGPMIVGKGVVGGRRGKRAYKFNPKFRSPKDNWPWSHQVPVKWESNLPQIEILLGAEQFAVKPLSPGDVRWLEDTIKKTRNENRQIEALEGEESRAEAIFRSRNHALIYAKKANSDYRCEVCRFKFENRYGEIGSEYIIAHHLKAIASGPSKTTLDDIALVCANCHAMIHTRTPAYSIDELRKLVKGRRLS